MRNSTIIAVVSIICITVIVTISIVFQGGFDFKWTGMFSKVDSVEDAVDKVSSYTKKDFEGKTFFTMSVSGEDAECEYPDYPQQIDPGDLAQYCNDAKTQFEEMIRTRIEVPEDYYLVMGGGTEPEDMGMYMVTPDGEVKDITYIYYETAFIKTKLGTVE